MAVFKGIAQPKMNILSSFTHTHVVSNLYFLSSVELISLYRWWAFKSKRQRTTQCTHVDAFSLIISLYNQTRSVINCIIRWNTHKHTQMHTWGPAYQMGEWSPNQQIIKNKRNKFFIFCLCNLFLFSLKRWCHSRRTSVAFYRLFHQQTAAVEASCTWECTVDVLCVTVG